METLTFLCELKEVKALKTVSNDKELRVVLITDDRNVASLIDDDPDQLYRVTIEKE